MVGVTDPDTGPGAPIPLATVANLRDLGGWRTTDGRQVAYGVVFRSTDLSRLSEPDRAALETLGVATVYDFRSVAERTTEPDVALDGVQQVTLDVLADAPHAVPGNLTKVLSDPAMLAAARSELGGRGVRELMEGSYQQLVTLPSALSSYRRFFRGLLGDHPAPALFHCTTGKDRTGWAAATLLTLLGVPVEDVYREYLLTNDQLVPALEPIVTAFTRAGGDPQQLWTVLGVDGAYLDRAFATVDEEYGTIADYFADGLGIDDQAQDELRDRYLTLTPPAGS
jgi:protein-tyrosine phosphatase